MNTSFNTASWHTITRDWPLLAALFFLYVLAHGGMLLLGQDIFWDDWFLVDKPPSVIIEYFSQLGAPYFVYLHVWLLKLGPPAYRILTFFLLFGAGLFVWGILSTIRQLDAKDRFLFTALFLLAPVYAARSYLICFPYTLDYTLFFAAWYLWARNTLRPSYSLHLMALVLFFISFQTQSLLVFFALPVAHIFTLRQVPNPSGVASFCLRNIDFLLLPFVAYMSKALLFPAYGSSSGYNQLAVSEYIAYFTSDINYVSRTFINFARDLLVTPSWLLLFAGLFALFLGISLTRRAHTTVDTETGDTHPRLQGMIFITIGIGAMYLAIVPYLMVRKIPDFVEPWSRHQLLIPFGMAMSSFGIGRLLPAKLRRFWFAGLLAFFITANIDGTVAFHRDAIKQDALMHEFAESPAIRAGDNFSVIDFTCAYDARNRRYRDYEYVGMLRRVFAETTRYADSWRARGISRWQKDVERRVSDIHRKGFYFPGPVSDRPSCQLRISPGKTVLSGLPLAHLFWQKTFAAPEVYQAALTDILNVECVPFTDDPDLGNTTKTDCPSFWAR